MKGWPSRTFKAENEITYNIKYNNIIYKKHRAMKGWPSSTSACGRSSILPPPRPAPPGTNKVNRPCALDHFSFDQ